MFVLAYEVELHVVASQSLKDKRQVVKSILDGGRRRYGVSASEVGFQDQWQRARLGFAVVASEPGPGHRDHRQGGPLRLVPS